MDTADYFSSNYIENHKEDKSIKNDVGIIREQYLSLLENLKTDLEILQGTYKKNDYPTINF